MSDFLSATTVLHELSLYLMQVFVVLYLIQGEWAAPTAAYAAVAPVMVAWGGSHRSLLAQHLAAKT